MARIVAFQEGTLDIDDPDELRARSTKPFFGLGPFAFRCEWESMFRNECDFSRFAKEFFTGSDVLPRFPELRNVIRPETIEYLYEQCLELRLENAMIAKAFEITAKKRPLTHKRWRTLRREFFRLRILLGGYKYIDIEKRLRRKLKINGDSVTLNAVAHISTLLAELEQVTSWWEGLADQPPLKAIYRGYVWTMDQHLKKYCPVKKELRANIIAAAIKWMRAESRVSQESIERLLTREAKKPRRFAFDGGFLEAPRKKSSITGNKRRGDA